MSRPLDVPRHIVSRVLLTLAVIAPLLTAISTEPADAVTLPDGRPDCAITESGVSTRALGRWELVDGELTATCSYRDAALPPVFAPTNFDVTLTFASVAATERRWLENYQGDDPFFGVPQWGTELGNPVDFAADAEFGLGFRVWGCEGGVRDPAACAWETAAVARADACAYGFVETQVQGVDAVPSLIQGESVAPPIDWGTIRRATQRMAAALADQLPTDTGCAPSCTYSGSAAFDFAPLVFVRIEVIQRGSVIATGETDGAGRYRIVSPCTGVGARNEDDRPRVRLSLSDTADRFEVTYRGGLVRIESPPLAAPGPDLTHDFNWPGLTTGHRSTSSPPVPESEWYALVEIYRNTQRAWALTEVLGISPDDDLPLEVATHCTTATCAGNGQDFAFWVGSDDPYIAYGPATSRITDSGKPDNREFHEVGHAVFYDGLNARPIAASVGAHAGNLNDATHASVSEGWAEFYAAMVNKHVVGRPNPHVYNPGGLTIDFEHDWKPFTGAAVGDIWLDEEFAVAALLLDLEDGPGDYEAVAHERVDVSNVRTQPIEGQPRRTIEGTLDNRSGTFLTQVYVTIFFHRGGRTVHTTTTLIDGANLAQNSRGSFVAHVENDVDFDDMDIFVTTGDPFTSRGDDDPIDLTPATIWRTIAGHRAAAPAGDRTVVDLYDAFRGLLGTRDADGNGRADIDDVFIAHGLYSRSDGDDLHEPTDVVGRTDRRQGEVRRRTPTTGLPGLRLDVRDAPEFTQFELVVSGSGRDVGRVNAFLVWPEADGTVTLPSVPADADVTVTVIARYDNGGREVVDHLTARELQNRRERATPVVASFDPPRRAAGYRLLQADGTVHVFGGAAHLGDFGGSLEPGERAVSMATTASTEGYMILTDRGTVGRAGDAPALDFGDGFSLQTGEVPQSISIHPGGEGFWVFTNRGGVGAFAGAPHLGDIRHLDLNGEVIASVPTPTGNGYYLLGADGGVFTFGDAGFHGSVPQVLPGVELDCPIVGIVPTPTGGGYWLVACDGGVFAFGDAGFVGSLPGIGVRPVSPINGMVAFGDGYLMVAGDGGAFNFGAPFFGSLGGSVLSDPVVAITPYLG